MDGRFHCIYSNVPFNLAVYHPHPGQPAGTSIYHGDETCLGFKDSGDNPHIGLGNRGDNAWVGHEFVGDIARVG